MNEDGLKKFFRRHEIQAEVHHYEAMRRKMYYARVGRDRGPALLFVHGAPASMTIYKKFFKDQALLNQFTLYAVDRAGYGVTNGAPEPSIGRQAAMIHPLAEKIRAEHGLVLILGGSYGASIVCRLVMDAPAIADGLVLVAPSLGPGLEKMFWIAPSLAKGVMSKLVSREYRAASVEKLHHQQELEKMLPMWDRIRVPVCYIQSEADGVVYTSNADFAKKKLVHAPVLKTHFLPGRKHDVDARYEPEIRNEIIGLFEVCEHRKPTISGS